ncbi:MAG: transketolase [Clostridia bacterium]
MDLKRLADLRRADAVTMITLAGTGHIGGAMSCLDILTCLYYQVMRIDPKQPGMPDRDRLILSKGHSVEGLYAILADLGFFDKKELRTFAQEGSRLISHPHNKVPGVEMCTGSLGHGLSIGVGMALAAKRTGTDYKTFVILGDGELAEGSIWEAAMAGAAYKLDNLYAIIDRNRLQISGCTEDVMPLEDLRAKWEAFGWDVSELDGHNMEALVSYFNTSRQNKAPHCLIAHTVKGKGILFAEDRAEWHHQVPTQEQLQEAYAALGVKGVDWI